MTNKEYQATCKALRDDLQAIVSRTLLLDQALPKRLKGFTVARIMVVSQQGGPVSVVDAIKAIVQAFEDSRIMAEAWDRFAEPEPSEVDGAIVPIRPGKSLND